MDPSPKIDFLRDDYYSELKREYQINSKCLKRELHDINIKLKNIDKQRHLGDKPIINILHGFSNIDSNDKKHLVTLIPPLEVNYHTKAISLELNSALSKILLTK